MTQWKTILHQRSRWLPHLEPPTPHDADLLSAYLRLSHGTGLGTALFRRHRVRPRGMEAATMELAIVADR